MRTGRGSGGGARPAVMRTVLGRTLVVVVPVLLGFTLAACAPPKPDLRVTINDAPDPVSGRGSVAYTVRVTSSDRATTMAPRVALLRVAVSASATDVVFTPPTGYDCTRDGPGADVVPYTCRRSDAASADTIAAGATRVFGISAKAPAGPGTFGASALVDPQGNVDESNEGNNEAITTTTVPSFDLLPSVGDTPDPASPHRQLTWTIRVNLNGSNSATLQPGGRLVRFALPATVGNVTTTPASGYVCDTSTVVGATRIVRCDRDASSGADVLSGGGVRAFLIQGFAPARSGSPNFTLDTSVTVDPLGVVVESNEANNIASTSTLVIMPNLQSTNVDSPDPVTPGGNVNWTVTVVNNPTTVGTGGGSVTVTPGTRLLRFVVENAPFAALSAPSGSGYTCQALTATSPIEYVCDRDASAGYDSIDRGASRSFTAIGLAPTSGTITATATADPSGAIAEALENDNHAVSTTLVRLP